MTRFERLTLLLMASGAGFAWMAQYLFYLLDLSDWVYRFYTLGIAVPAAALGCFAFPRYCGFTKRAPLAFAALLAIGLAWTDTTEYKRGLVVAISFAMTLPLSALIRKHSYLKPAMWAFGVGTAASMALAMTQPMSPGRWGTLIYNGIPLSNPAGVGLHCATALALICMAMHRSASFGKLRVLQVSLMMFLLVCCVLTASRTAFLALIGASCVALLISVRRNLLRVMLGLTWLLLFVGTAIVATAAFTDRPFYDQLLERTLGDDNEALSTLGGRTDIWRFGSEQFFQGTHWISGFGTGSVDKLLGEFSGIDCRDGIWRLYAHNTFVWCGLGLGTLGLMVGGWLTLSMVRSAYRFDRMENGYQRCSLVAFLILFGTGAVVHLEQYWILLGSILWALMSLQHPIGARSPAARKSAI
jgi:hypothetical protein